jgi:phytoene dehydrogenase-like protein
VDSLALVIGAGVNELVAAQYLARAGRRVIMLDERLTPGDTPVTVGWIPPHIVRDLALEQHGLVIHRLDPWAAAPLPAGDRLELSRDMARSIDAIRRVNPRDAAKWPVFCERMGYVAQVLAALYSSPPPDPLSRELRDLAQVAAVALRTRRLGRQAVEDLFRLLPMSVADLLDDWFENDALKGMLGAAGVMHLCQGPRSGGTAFALLHHHVGSAIGVFRPPLSNLERVLRDLPGIEIRRAAAVTRIHVRDHQVTGVQLASGEGISASLILSGADPKRTLLQLLDAGWLDPEFCRATKNIRARGVAARIRLGLDRPPGFSNLVIAPSLDYLEHAYDDAKYGRVSQQPYLEVRADDGNRIEVHAQYAPYALTDGEWDGNRRAALGHRAVALLSQHVAHLGTSVREREACSPRDLEDIDGFPEGQAHHAELALDQALWMRPIAGWARYRTPIGGLYLCGPATHPGGSIAGAAGANAARVVAEDGS